MKSNSTLKAMAALTILLAGAAYSVPSFAANTDSTSTTTATASIDKSDLYNTVKQLIDDGQLKQAESVVDKALQENPKNAAAYFCKSAIAYSDHRSFDEVLQYLNNAVELDPTFEAAVLVRGRILKAMNDYRTAVKDFDAVLARDPENSEAMDNSIDIKVALGDFKGLVDDYSIKIRINPNDAEAYFKRGYCEYQLGQQKLAIADLKQAKQLYVAAKDDDSAKQVDQYIADAQKAA